MRPLAARTSRARKIWVPVSDEAIPDSWLNGSRIDADDTYEGRVEPLVTREPRRP